MKKLNVEDSLNILDAVYKNVVGKFNAVVEDIRIKILQLKNC